MKISPVNGTPTIPNPSGTGLAPEKLARLKAIAAGQVPVELTEEEKQTLSGRIPTPSIKMTTNRTIHREIEPPTTDVVSPAADTTNVVPDDETAISDAGVPTNGAVEATQPLSPQFAALARQRRALQIKEQQLAEKIKAQEGPTRAELEARIKSQPLSVLQELGVTYDQLTNDILAAQNGTNPQIEALKEEIKALKDGVDKTLSEKDANAEKAVLSEMRRTVNRLSAQGDDFELIRETQSQPDVIELIHRTWKETGEVLDEAEAMRLVEEELVNDSLKIAKLKKVQGKLTPTEPLQPQPTQQTGMRTLTNKDQAKPAMDRRQRAILAMQGHLKR